MSTSSATKFRKLHVNTTPLRLPNAWDAGSARLFESLGAPTIATTSAGVAWALGYRDGRSLPVEEAIGVASRIVRVVKVPVTVDIENGYSDDPQAVAGLVKRLADVGVVGINIEDGTDNPKLLTDKIEAIRKALSAAGTDVFVNVRTDVYLEGLAKPSRLVEETLKRGKLYVEAGADGLFVPGLHKADDIKAVVSDVPVPLNIMAWPGLADASALGKLGVRRLSAGPGVAQAAWTAAQDAANQFLETGNSDALYAASKEAPSLQRLLPGT